MLDYRKFFGSRKTRMIILSGLSWIPDKIILNIQYFLQTGEKLHLKKPVKYTEYLQAYKLYYHNPEMKGWVDKVEARNLVKEKGLKDILVPEIAVYNNPDEIDFNNLPKKFVMKSSDGGGSNEVVVCRDISKLDVNELKKTVSNWYKLPKSKKHIAREWAYENDYPRRILVERLLEDEKQRKDIDDFKFFCFNGKYKLLEWHKDRTTAHKAAHYDENLNYLPEFYTYDTMHTDNPLPANIKEMVKVAEKLAEGFPFVRVDLYNVGGKIYFGEMTFYPASGYFLYRPDSVNVWIGSLFKEIDFEKYLQRKKN